MPAAPQRLQLCIALENVKPKIWRRVIVPASIAFSQLHQVIQRAMGWEGVTIHLPLENHPTMVESSRNP